MTEKGNEKMKNKDPAGILLMILFAIQPVLDVVAYWTRNGRATPAGFIRLGILLLLPVWVLITTKEKKRFFLALAVAAVPCLLHVANNLRLGYLNPVYDLRYMASVLQMPVFALCFVMCIGDDDRKEAALKGFAIAAGLTLLFYILALISGTANVTYGKGMGYSGWVIDDNRNANSTNLVIYAALGLRLAFRSKRKWMSYSAPLAVTAVFLSVGTKACYFSIFVLLPAYFVFLLLEEKRSGERADRPLLALLILLTVFSAVIYPWTPRYRITEEQRKASRGQQGEIETTLLEQGIDISDMSPQERFENPRVKEVFEFYYWKYMGSMPDIFDRFGMDRVLMRYKMSTDVGKLIDARVIERNYAAMIFEDCDFLTKLTGYEATLAGTDGYYDLENDWHAIFYYYGYLGFVLYVGFVLAFLLKISRALIRDFRACLTTENLALGLTLVLILGLAHFSGATLRRPNVSIWLSLVLALCNYAVEGLHHETEHHCARV